jgi:hypothetical protein
MSLTRSNILRWYTTIMFKYTSNEQIDSEIMTQYHLQKCQKSQKLRNKSVKNAKFIL